MSVSHNVIAKFGRAAGTHRFVMFPLSAKTMFIIQTKEFCRPWSLFMLYGEGSSRIFIFLFFSSSLLLSFFLLSLSLSCIFFFLSFTFIFSSSHFFFLSFDRSYIISHCDFKRWPASVRLQKHTRFACKNTHNLRTLLSSSLFIFQDSIFFTSLSVLYFVLFHYPSSLT